RSIVRSKSVDLQHSSSRPSRANALTDRQSEWQTWLLKRWAEWFRVLRPLGGWVPWELRELVEQSAEPGGAPFWGEGIVKEAPQLRGEYLRNCMVLTTQI